jgi:hypothetical protein
MEHHYLPNALFVKLEEIRQAIKAFEGAARNPFGMNKAIPGHQPVWLEIRTGNPAPKKTGPDWPESPAFQIPLFNPDCDTEQRELYTHAGIMTTHTVIYPMTKAYVQKQWHRVYAYDVQTKEITEVRLLVSERQDPTYKAAGHKSAHEWIMSVERCGVPVFDGSIYTADKEET